MERRNLHIEISDMGIPRIGVIYDPKRVYNPPKDFYKECSQEFNESSARSAESTITKFFEIGTPYIHIVIQSEIKPKQLAEKLADLCGCLSTGGITDALFTFVATESQSRDIIEYLRKNKP